MTLGRLIRSIQADRYSAIPPRWLTKLFVLADVMSCFVQGGGAGMMYGGDPASMKRGEVRGQLGRLPADPRVAAVRL